MFDSRRIEEIMSEIYINYMTLIKKYGQDGELHLESILNMASKTEDCPILKLVIRPISDDDNSTVIYIVSKDENGAENETELLAYDIEFTSKLYHIITMSLISTTYGIDFDIDNPDVTRKSLMKKLKEMCPVDSCEFDLTDYNASFLDLTNKDMFCFGYDDDYDVEDDPFYDELDDEDESFDEDEICAKLEISNDGEGLTHISFHSNVGLQLVRYKKKFYVKFYNEGHYMYSKQVDSIDVPTLFVLYDALYQNKKDTVKNDKAKK